MPLFYGRTNLTQLDERLCEAPALDAGLMTEVIDTACSRLALLRHSERAASAERLIASGAWTDAVLVLLALESPQWQLRRLTYDDGEWHCALSNQREMPEWLDQSIEAHHANLPVAILRAFVAARQVSASAVKSSLLSVPPMPHMLDEPACCDNFV